MRISPDALELLGSAVGNGYVEPCYLTDEEIDFIKQAKSPYKEKQAKYNKYTLLEMERRRRFKERQQQKRMSRTFSINAKRIRRKKRMTQKEIAEAIGISQQGYAAYERNAYVATYERIQEVAIVLGVTVEELLKEE
jgi:DNA-binding XRE family transcriptional regulator